MTRWQRRAWIGGGDESMRQDELGREGETRQGIDAARRGEPHAERLGRDALRARAMELELMDLRGELRGLQLTIGRQCGFDEKEGHYVAAERGREWIAMIKAILSDSHETKLNESE